MTNNLVQFLLFPEKNILDHYFSILYRQLFQLLLSLLLMMMLLLLKSIQIRFERMEMSEWCNKLLLHPTEGSNPSLIRRKTELTIIISKAIKLLIT
jgi:hypothetical protein